MSFENRFRKLLAEKNLTASAMAEEIGIQASTLSHILSGRNKPSVDILIKLKQAYPTIDLEWLLTGFLNEKEPTPPYSIDKMTSPLLENDLTKEVSETNEIERIVFFFKNGSFKEYKNNS